MIGEFPRTAFCVGFIFVHWRAHILCRHSRKKIPFQMKNVISQLTDTISLGKHCAEPGIRALFIVKRQTLLYKTVHRYLVRKSIHIPLKRQNKLCPPTSQTFTYPAVEKNWQKHFTLYIICYWDFDLLKERQKILPNSLMAHKIWVWQKYKDSLLIETIQQILQSAL